MILVTGGTGIVGIRIVFELLQRNKRVRVLKRDSSDLEFVIKVFEFYDPRNGKKLFGEIEWVEGDILDVFTLEDAMKDVNEVYHSAALVSYDPSDADRLIKTNAEGTANVVNAALSENVEAFCHISSVAALGTEKKNREIDENSMWKRDENRSQYGLSKFMAEREVWRGAAEGLKVVIVNPSIIIGPSKPDQSSGKLISLLRKGPLAYPIGSVGMVNVRDVASMSIELMEAGKFNERFILNSENLSYRKLLTSAASVFDNPPPRFKLPPILLEIGWRIVRIGSIIFQTQPRVTKETAKSASRKLKYNHSKVTEALGKEFIPIEESLEEVRRFYLEAD